MKYLFVAILALGASPVMAAGPTQDWPCVQVLQPKLSLGSMWSAPGLDDDAAELARTDQVIRGTADRIAQRRTSLDQAGEVIDAFAEDADTQRLAALFLAVFQRIDTERAALLTGISRYGHGQGKLADRIEERRVKMSDMEAATEPDFDAIDAEEVGLDWDVRIFEERRQMLRAVCESPVLLERRLYEIGKLIQAKLPETE